MPFLIKLLISLIVISLGGVLDAWGGKNFRAARVFIEPCLLAVGISLLTGIWWAGILVLPMMGTLSLPYSKYGNFGRGMWVWLDCLAAGILLVGTNFIFHNHLLAWHIFLGYAIIGGIYGGIYRLWNVRWGDWGCGAILCSLIVLVWVSKAFGL